MVPFALKIYWKYLSETNLPAIRARSERNLFSFLYPLTFFRKRNGGTPGNRITDALLAVLRVAGKSGNQEVEKLLYNLGDRELNMDGFRSTATLAIPEEKRYYCNQRWITEKHWFEKKLFPALHKRHRYLFYCKEILKVLEQQIELGSDTQFSFRPPNFPKDL